MQNALGGALLQDSHIETGTKNMIHQSRRAVNTQFALHEVIYELIARPLLNKIADGGHERCPNCLQWVSSKNYGMVAVYFPYSGTPPTPYVICKKCAKLATGTEKQRIQFKHRVESYLDGGAL